MINVEGGIFAKEFMPVGQGAEFGRNEDGWIVERFENTSLGNTIDKVYIDGPCVVKTLAGVLLERLERVSHVIHSYEYEHIGAVWFDSGISTAKCLQYDWARKVLITKKFQLSIYLSIPL